MLNDQTPNTSVARIIQPTTTAITAAVPVPTSPEKLFAWVSRLEHVPLWATEFCQGFRIDHGVGYTQTPFGPAAIRVDADASSGVVDVLVTDREGSTVRYPARVIGLPQGRSALLFTVVRRPDVNDEEMKAEVASLERELQNIRVRFEDEAVTKA